MEALRPRIPPFLGKLLRHKEILAEDRLAAREHRWSRESPELPEGLELQWLGTAGYRMSYQGHRILIDPYVTRAGLRELALERELEPSRTQIARYIEGPVHAVLMGHTHFDHALDAPEIARTHDAKVYGSRSMANLMRSRGLAGQSVEVEPYQVYDIGPFEVTFVPSVHSKLVLGLFVPWDGDIAAEPARRMRAAAYRCGQTFAVHISVAGTSFYHQGSANLIDDAIRHRDVDYFLAAISGRGFTENYVTRILRKLRPRTVVPHHYDDFLRPLHEPVGFSFNVGLAEFVREVHDFAPATEIKTLEVLETVRG